MHIFHRNISFHFNFQHFSVTYYLEDCKGLYQNNNHQIVSQSCVKAWESVVNPPHENYIKYEKHIFCFMGSVCNKKVGRFTNIIPIILGKIRLKRSFLSGISMDYDGICMQ